MFQIHKIFSKRKCSCQTKKNRWWLAITNQTETKCISPFPDLSNCLINSSISKSEKDWLPFCSTVRIYPHHWNLNSIFEKIKKDLKRSLLSLFPSKNKFLH